MNFVSTLTINYKIWHNTSFEYRSTLIILLKKRVVLGPPRGPENLKNPKALYQLLLNLGTKSNSNAGVLLILKKYRNKERSTSPLELPKNSLNSLNWKIKSFESSLVIAFKFWEKVTLEYRIVFIIIKSKNAENVSGTLGVPKKP